MKYWLYLRRHEWAKTQGRNGPERHNLLQGRRFIRHSVHEKGSYLSRQIRL